MNGIFKIVSPNDFFMSVTSRTHLSLYTCDKTTLKYIQLQGNCGRKSTIPVKEFIIHTHTCRICVNVLQEIGGIKDIIWQDCN